MFTPGLQELGGAATESRRLIKGLVARGWDVRVVTRAGAQRRPSFRRWKGALVVEVPGFALGRIGAIPFLGAAFLLGLAWARGTQAYVAIQFSSPATVAGTLALLLRRGAVILMTSGGNDGEAGLLTRGPLARVRRSLFSRATVLPQTHSALLELVDLVPAERLAVLPTPAPDGEPQPLSGEPRVLFAGRFAAEKNVLTLLNAWRRVAAEVPRARLTLAGSGGSYRSTEAEVQAAIADDETLRSTVSLPGWVSELPGLLCAHDVFVLPSTTEGLSNVLLEACVLGRVVVASDIPQNVDVLGETYPLLFSPRSVDELASALTSALSDDDVRAQARTEIAARIGRFRLSSVLDGLEEAINAAADHALDQS